MTNITVNPNAARQRQQVIGTFGVVIAVSVAVILGVHPWGSTDLYNDGVEFVDHVGPFWVAIHFVGAMLFLGMPTVIGAWADTLRTPAGQVFGKVAASWPAGRAAGEAVINVRRLVPEADKGGSPQPPCVAEADYVGRHLHRGVEIGQGGFALSEAHVPIRPVRGRRAPRFHVTVPQRTR